MCLCWMRGQEVSPAPTGNIAAVRYDLAGSAGVPLSMPHRPTHVSGLSTGEQWSATLCESQRTRRAAVSAWVKLWSGFADLRSVRGQLARSYVQALVQQAASRVPDLNL